MLKPEWSTVLITVQLFLTSEGRYSKVYLYHKRFLYHLVGFSKMNLLYFLHQSLLNMCTKERTRPELQPHDIFHHDLIKILYTHELNK